MAVELVGSLLMALIASTGSASARDELPGRLVEGGLAAASLGGGAAAGGFSAVEIGREQCAVWAGIERYGAGTGVSGVGVFRVPIRRGVRAAVLGGVARAAWGCAVPFGGGGRSEPAE